MNEGQPGFGGTDGREGLVSGGVNNGAVPNQLNVDPMAGNMMMNDAGLNNAVPNQPMANPTDDIIINTGDGGGKKSKKWLIVGIVVAVALVMVGLGAVALTSQNGGLGALFGGVKMSNKELAKELSQINHDLKVLSKSYNDMFTVERGNDSVIYGKKTFEEYETECNAVEELINQLPSVDKTNLKAEDYDAYTELVKEMRQRLETIKSGMKLAKEFHEAFFWPIMSYELENDEPKEEPVGQENLLNSSDSEVRSLANVLNDYYQLVIQGGSEDDLTEFSLNHTDIWVKYYKCFTGVDGTEEFYKKVYSFMERIRNE